MLENSMHKPEEKGSCGQSQTELPVTADEIRATLSLFDVK